MEGRWQDVIVAWAKQTAPKARAADWTVEHVARNERQATREVGGPKRAGGAKK
jgi:hypothetical protein